MSKQESIDKEANVKKRVAVEKKLKQEPNKYFVPALGEVDADSLEDLQNKLKERQEDK